MGLPKIPGSPIFVSARPQLTAHRGKLLSGRPESGTAVHAASFIRERRIVVERELLGSPDQFRLILVHELFHFVWPRLSNHVRAEYGELLKQELRSGARGELGESSEVRKTALASGLKCWKEYVCESFCDTAAWRYAGIQDNPKNSHFRLAQRWKERRMRWFTRQFEGYWETRYL